MQSHEFLIEATNIATPERVAMLLQQNCKQYYMLDMDMYHSVLTVIRNQRA